MWAAASVRLSGLLSIVVILVMTWLGLRLVRLAKVRVLKRFLRGDDAAPGDAHRQGRVSTIVSVGAYSVNVLIISVAAISVLSALGINVVPLITSLGIVGLALSLGTQTIVKDYVSGLIVLAENLYMVGETVTIGSFSGEVERLTMRVTWLRAADGKLHVIPNGDVRAVTNQSRDWGLAEASFELPPQANLPEGLQALEQAARQVRALPELQRAFLSEPEVHGQAAAGDAPVKLRAAARVKPDRRQAVEQALLAHGEQALKQAGAL